ncbi:hypothetical protein N8993_11540 [Pseudomonadales bacterium]|nr:hypothetical protein [Pseudomonadales bacterium]MDB2543313.1 hypothetical protein [Pseudomonadales bacterium]
MRDVFISALTEYAANDPNVLLITGDLGFGVLTEFAENKPKQFINAGVAEQNMTGIATGMALSGNIVFTYSIANFPTLRCLEQIRNDVLYHDAPVNIVSVGGGFSYGALGMSHHATEDVAIMRALPGLRMFTPSDQIETEAAVALMINEPAPSFIRLDKSKVDSNEFLSATIDGPIRPLRKGSEVAILGYGGILREALGAVERLEKQGISPSVYSIPMIKPMDTAALADALRGYSLIVSLEEHVAYGGLGSLLADTMVDEQVDSCRLLRFGLPDSYSSIVGSQEYLRSRFELDADSVAKKIVERLGTPS